MTRRLALARQGGTEQTTVTRRLLSDLAQNRLGSTGVAGILRLNGTVQIHPQGG